MNFPENLKYTPNHEWLRVEGNIGIAGVTDHAQSELGDVVYIDIPDPDITVEKGKSFGTIEAVKTVADIFAPVSGKIIVVNPLLADAPETVNSDCYGEGWIVKIEMSNPAECVELLDVDAYKQIIGQ